PRGAPPRRRVWRWGWGGPPPPPAGGAGPPANPAPPPPPAVPADGTSTPRPGVTTLPTDCTVTRRGGGVPGRPGSISTVRRRVTTSGASRGAGRLRTTDLGEPTRSGIPTRAGAVATRTARTCTTGAGRSSPPCPPASITPG